MNAILIITIIILPLTLILHAMNNMLIFLRKRLHKPSYYILINLSVSDIMMLIAVIIRFMYTMNNVFLELAFRGFVTTSVFLTFGMTLDRYIAVVYSLEYRGMLSKSRLTLFLILLWIMSFLLTAIPTLITSDEIKRSMYCDFVLVPIYIFTCVASVVASLWIRSIRNKHEKEIKKRNTYFGIESETLGVLESLKTSLLDVIKLNLITAVLLLNAEILRMISKYCFNSMNIPLSMTVTFLSFLYVIMNPIVYIISMSELKQEYRNLLCCWNTNDNDIYNNTNTNNSNTTQSNSSNNSGCVRSKNTSAIAANP